jgi:predicted N-formylglutamate amidohydrolase
MRTTTLLFTSEHGSYKIPSKYKKLFLGHDQLLATHRGHDLGAWSLAESLAQGFGAQLFKTDVSRLLVDVNRSLWRRTLFSEITKPLPKNQKKIILEKFYYPHREQIAAYIDDHISNGQKILHIATHSFTPVLKGHERTTDIGLLYNPERLNEKQISKEWKLNLKKDAPDLRVRFNYPYRGKPDGLTAHFRKSYPDEKYLGVELELNQKFVLKDGKFPKEILGPIVSSLRKTLDHFSWL